MAQVNVTDPVLSLPDGYYLTCRCSALCQVSTEKTTLRSSALAFGVYVSTAEYWRPYAEDAFRALACEHFAMEALAEQPDAQWLRDLGIQFRLDYGSRPLHTFGLDICHDYVGLRNLGNSCYLNSVVQCIYGCAPLREDVTGQSPPKGPLSRHSQRLFQQLSGEDGRWDYVSPAALLHQVLLTDDAAFQYGESADASECCSMLLHSCLTRPALFMEPQDRLGRAGRSAKRSDASGRGVTVGRLMQAHFGDSFWPSTSAAILRLQPGPGDRLSWNDWTVRVPVKAQYTETGFIWHGNDHYVAYLVRGQQWYCLNDGGVASRKRARSVPEDPEEEGKGISQMSALAVKHELGISQMSALAVKHELGKTVTDLAGKGISQMSALAVKHELGKTVTDLAGRLGKPDRTAARIAPVIKGKGVSQMSALAVKHELGKTVTDLAGKGISQMSALAVKHELGKTVTGLAGRQRHLADERAGREARARQDTAFSAASWSSNMDGSRADKINNEDNPFQRFRHAFSLTLPQERQKLREWPEQPAFLGAQPCLLCSGADFASRGELHAHIDAQHGGLQRYRNAFLHMESLCPHVVTGSEVRYYVGNYAEFLRSSAMDWDQQKPAQPRERLGCAFCARLAFGRPKVLHEEACCSMGYAVSGEVSRAVASHTAGRVGSISCPPSTEAQLVLLHKRRLGPAIISGQSPAAVCSECADAFSPSRPRMCKYALANDLWLGRPDPLLWDANMTYEMCLALARTVATKVVLRAGGAAQQEPISGQRWAAGAICFSSLGWWDPLWFSTMATRSMLCSLCRHRSSAMPSQSLSARTFLLQFLQQADALRRTNPVYKDGVAEINRQLLSEWLQQEESAAPPVVLDCVVTVPVGDSGPGIVVQSGPASATEAAQQSLQDTQLKQEMEETCVLALEPQVQDFNEQGKEASLAIVSLLQKLEPLEQAGARSVALEMESVVDEQRTLVDYLGRAKILQLCREVHETCKQLSGPEQRSRLEMELRDAVMGKSRWLHRADEAQEADAQADSAASPHLLLARGKKPLSLWDWKIWTMAKPRLWRYGDAGNLYERAVTRLTEQRAASYNFLRNGGMAFAKSIEKLTAEDLAMAARNMSGSGGIEQFVKQSTAPQSVKDALLAMHCATATVVGSDGHRRLCRHEGVAYMETFGPPLIFVTPNVADAQHPLLLVVQGEALSLGEVTADMRGVLPKYREMLHRIAQDPVAQTVQFDLLMPLFFQHVLVRPETLQCGRGSARTFAREWCSDGAAASSTGAGMLGPVLAFRGEIEAQGRGSLHPHILVWLVCRHMQVLSDLACLLRHQKATLQNRLRDFMFMAVASFESVCQSSVQAAQPVPVSSVAQQLCKFDGGSELCLHRDMENLTQEQQDVLDSANEEQWRRPCLEVEPARSAAGSIYSTPINMLPDLHNLSSSLLKHMCSDSCFKYSEAGSPSFKICRHGFYHVVYVCEGCRCRRKGKALRPSVHVCSEAEAEFGMSGRLRPIQLTPFEVQTNYGGIVAGRQNLDVQDMRRVLDPSLWLPAGVRVPHIGSSCDQLGYMALYEWNGKYEQRPSSCDAAAPVSWLHHRALAAPFRHAWLQAHTSRQVGASSPRPSPASSESLNAGENDSVEEDWNDLPNAISCGINEAFCPME
ncbi:unnamed protein product [Effrenium voratum]|nr:unnamed protein product [Effrenium voratum]